MPPLDSASRDRSGDTSRPGDPARNGSLGRGLGDLIGGVPKSIGVARPAPVPASPVSAPQTALTAPAAVPAAWWTPVRMVIAGLAAAFLMLLGFRLGSVVFSGKASAVAEPSGASEPAAAGDGDRSAAEAMPLPEGVPAGVPVVEAEDALPDADAATSRLGD